MRRFSIGRATTNDIVLDDMTVSRSHAEIEELGRGRFVLRDQESTYGTKILRDNEWIEVIEIEVAPQTMVRFGEYEVNVGEIINQVDGDATYMPKRDAAAPVQPNSERSEVTPPPPPAAPPAAPPAGQNEAPQNQEAITPTPAAPKPAKPKRAKQPKVPKTPRPAAGPGAPDKRMTMLILIGGGGAAALLLLIGIVLAFVGGGSSPAVTGTNTPGGNIGSITGRQSSDKSNFMAACKEANRPEAECSCSWNVVSSKMNAEERKIFIAIIRNRANSTKLIELTKNMSNAARQAFAKKASVVAREVKANCEKR